MKTLKAGLISAGGVSQSFVARMPALLKTVGPVKATSARVARRIANSLRAGSPVEGYGALNGCPVIWIALPEAGLDRVLREFSAEAPLAGKKIVICGTARPSGSFPELADAFVATLDCVPGDERTLVAEGHPMALREIDRAAVAERRKLIKIAMKPAYLAGVHFASGLLLPYFSSAVEMLRQTGFSRMEATRVAEGLGSRTLRAYAKAGRKAWSRVAAIDLRASRERDGAAIRAADGPRAALYERGIEQALEYFKDE